MFDEGGPNNANSYSETKQASANADPVFRQHDFSSATELLAALSPRSSFFRSDEPGDWLFRGQANADWSLVPGALRPLATSILKRKELTTATSIKMEIKPLREFFWRADAQGLPIPGDSPRLRDFFSEEREAAYLRRTYDSVRWPPDDFVPLMALAQHYGVQTRLLDVTQRPFVAAYFAAREAAQWWMEPATAPGLPSSPPTHLAIWAVRWRHWYHRLEQLIGGPVEPPPFVEVTAPAATNHNLQSQGGRFLLCRTGVDLHEKVQELSLDEMLVKALQPRARFGARILKLRLPLSEAPALLYELYREGIDAATLFPGGAGVAMALRERGYWGRRGNAPPGPATAQATGPRQALEHLIATAGIELEVHLAGIGVDDPNGAFEPPEEPSDRPRIVLYAETPPSAEAELLTLAHEYGHYLSWRAGLRGAEYHQLITGTERPDWPNLKPAQKELILAEEFRAWAFAAAELAKVGYTDWASFVHRQAESLSNYRETLGLDATA